MDLFLIILFSLLTAPVIELSDGGSRILLGTVFLLLFPGYTLMAALFPQKESMDGIERAALTLVLSFALISLTGLALNYTPWGIRLTPIYLSMAFEISLFSLIAYLRRRHLPDDDRYETRALSKVLDAWKGEHDQAEDSEEPDPETGIDNDSISAHRKADHCEQKRWLTLDRALTIVLVIAVIGALGTLIYVITSPKVEEPFTDFFILGPEGMLENYPQQLALGEEASIVMGIKNHENQDTSYRVIVTFDDEKAQEIGPITLSDETEWRTDIILVPAKPGDDQKVQFLLYKENDGADPLSLHLWLDVRDTK